MEIFNPSIKIKNTPSSKTLRSRQSHLKLFELNNHTIEYFKTDANQKLDKLLDRKGNLLKPGYKAQLAITIKSLLPGTDVSVKTYRKQEKSITRSYSTEFIVNMKKIVEYAAQYLGGVYTNNELNTSTYEVCLAIMFSFCTTLTLDAIRLLKLRHFANIRNSELIRLKIKNRDYVPIPLNATLVALMDIIDSQRILYSETLFRQLKFTDDSRLNRYNNQYVFVYSESYLVKSLKKFVARTEITINTVGYATFNKLVTSFIDERNNLQLVNYMNKFKPTIINQENNNENVPDDVYVPINYKYNPHIDDLTTINTNTIITAKMD